MNVVSEETTAEGCIPCWNGGHADAWRDVSAAAEVERGRVWVNPDGEVSCAVKCDA